MMRYWMLEPEELIEQAKLDPPSPGLVQALARALDDALALIAKLEYTLDEQTKGPDLT